MTFLIVFCIVMTLQLLCIPIFYAFGYKRPSVKYIPIIIAVAYVVFCIIYCTKYV